MENNGMIHVAGDCNITTDGTVNIFARTDANIEVAQNATVSVGNVLSIGSANDTELAVGGDLKIKAVGDVSIQGANIYNKSEGNHNVQAASINVKGESVKQTSSGSMSIKSSADLNVDYGTYNLGTGSAQDADDSVDVSLTPPAAGTPLNPTVPMKIAPPRQFEDKAVIETPEDWDTPEGRAQADKTTKTEGVPGTPDAVASEGGGSVSGGSGKILEVDKSLINTTKDFTNDYRLSKNVVLGMVIDGGVGGKHKLQAQMLKPNANAQERLYTIQEIVGNLAETSSNVLENIIDVLPGGLSGYNKQWKITSGYRLKGVVANESPTSDHCKGHCLDIALMLPDKNRKTYELIQKIETLIPYDQLILEYRHPSSVWIHVAYRKDNNRKMAFTMVNDKVHKRNAGGLPYGFYLIDDIPPKG
jgi:hypothetical protein